MATSKKELVKKLLKNNNIEGTEEELLEMLIDQSIAIDPDKEKLSKGDKLADKFTEIAGSWTFIIIFTICLVLWIFLNLTKIIELDEYVKPGGLLVVHFTQYSFIDTVVSPKYKALGDYNQDDYKSSVFDKNSNLIKNPTSQKSIFIKQQA